MKVDNSILAMFYVDYPLQEMERPTGSGGLPMRTLEVLLSPELLQQVKVDFAEG